MEIHIINTLFLGTMSFIFSGIDDLLMLFYFYLVYPKYYNTTVVGIISALTLLILISYFLGNFLSPYISFYKSYFIIFLIIYLLYLLFQGYKAYTSKENIKARIKEERNKNIFFSSFIIYLINGLDDILMYTSYFSNQEITTNIFLFILGIYLGLFLWYYLIQKYTIKIQQIFKL